MFDRAKIAKEESKNAQENEEIKISEYDNEINSYINANRDYTPISYSTEEQDTGLKWINGKTIYQKTLVSNQAVTHGMNVDITDLNAEYIYMTSGTVISGNSYTPLQYCQQDANYWVVVYFDLENNRINFQGGNYGLTYRARNGYIITVQYTKKS